MLSQKLNSFSKRKENWTDLVITVGKKLSCLLISTQFPSVLSTVLRKWWHHLGFAVSLLAPRDQARTLNLSSGLCVPAKPCHTAVETMQPLSQSTVFNGNRMVVCLIRKGISFHSPTQMEKTKAIPYTDWAGLHFQPQLFCLLGCFLIHVGDWGSVYSRDQGRVYI